jgi:iron complex transport system substrate-binding protein
VIACVQVVTAGLREYNAWRRCVWVLMRRVRLSMGIDYRGSFRIVAVLLCGMLLHGAAVAEVRVIDDAGRPLSLAAPAHRIVSLAPHITELLFDVSAGGAVVGTSDFSDYPEAARAIPRVGGGGDVDLETVLALRPDLVIAWRSGNRAGPVRRLQQLGVPVFYSEPRHLEDIAATLERFGLLTGRREPAQRQARAFTERLDELRRRYADRERVSVYYQIWEHPLMTLNREHIVSDVIRLCGGRNVFADLPALVPQINIEAVLAADPDVILVGGGAGEPVDSLATWKRWPELKAVRQQHLYAIPRELLVRQTPRLLDGAERLCRLLEGVRDERGQPGTE